MRRIPIVAIAFVLLAVATPAWAHVDAPLGRAAMATTTESIATDVGPAALRAVSPASPSPWMLVAGAAIALALTLRRRRALVLALVVLLACGVFETGMHSVHHLTEADAAKCTIAAVSSHSGGLVVATVAVERPADAPTPAEPAHVQALASSRISAPDLGRAPPAA